MYSGAPFRIIVLNQKVRGFVLKKHSNRVKFGTEKGWEKWKNKFTSMVCLACIEFIILKNRCMTFHCINPKMIAMLICKFTMKKSQGKGEL